MEYKKFGNTIVVKMVPGEEVIEVVKIVATKENVKCAKVEGIGATDEFTVGAYSIIDKEYCKNDFTGCWEIISLLGNITTKDGEVYIHLHMSAGNENGNVVGGHLNRAVISVTCELFITIIDGTIERKLDPSTGINVFNYINFNKE